ncbi:hypothetical protein PRIPAC_80222 [Pristionchus pacificus]|uniref:Uncharacterized protein n=1 Tax=Pristionchus pacificus TaxID=54126 RepID=A0A2A6BWF5_PRIPA|nr:hypothetical protein PRIPAC_80222 [Pristionchus pacificus]|eukprot:PDM70332.1 hypothetical protein PRIPAC_46578 [Pristionchus pacificus]
MQILDKCFKAELTATRKEMIDKHTEIFVVYVGELSKKDATVLKYIHKDGKHLIHSEKFEDLRSKVANQLQKKIC